MPGWTHPSLEWEQENAPSQNACKILSAEHHPRNENKRTPLHRMNARSSVLNTTPGIRTREHSFTECLQDVQCWSPSQEWEQENTPSQNECKMLTAEHLHPRNENRRTLLHKKSARCSLLNTSTLKIRTREHSFTECLQAKILSAEHIYPRYKNKKTRLCRMPATKDTHCWTHVSLVREQQNAPSQNICKKRCSVLSTSTPGRRTKH